MDENKLQQMVRIFLDCSVVVVQTNNAEHI